MPPLPNARTILYNWFLIFTEDTLPWLSLCLPWCLDKEKKKKYSFSWFGYPILKMQYTYLLALLLPTAFAQYNYGGGSSPTTTSSAAAMPSQSGVHWVQVGAGSLTFQPDNLMAAVGDKINF